MTAAIVNLIVNYVAILLVGLWGAMIGTITAYLILAFVRIIDVKRFVDIGIDWKKLIGNSLILMTQTIITSLSRASVGMICSGILLCMFLTLNRAELMAVIMFVKRRVKKNV